MCLTSFFLEVSTILEHIFSIISSLSLDISNAHNTSRHITTLIDNSKITRLLGIGPLFISCHMIRASCIQYPRFHWQFSRWGKKVTTRIIGVVKKIHCFQMVLSHWRFHQSSYVLKCSSLCVPNPYNGSIVALLLFLLRLLSCFTPWVYLPTILLVQAPPEIPFVSETLRIFPVQLPAIHFILLLSCEQTPQTWSLGWMQPDRPKLLF